MGEKTPLFFYPISIKEIATIKLKLKFEPADFTEVNFVGKCCSSALLLWESLAAREKAKGIFKISMVWAIRKSPELSSTLVC